MIVNKGKYNLHILGLILILMILVFPIATAEDGGSDSSESSSESDSEDASSEDSSSDSSESGEGNDASGEDSSEDESSEQDNDDDDDVEESNEEINGEESVSTESDLSEESEESSESETGEDSNENELNDGGLNEVDNDSEFIEDIDEESLDVEFENSGSNILDDYQEDTDAVYYELGEEEPEQNENETAEPEYYEIDPEEVYEDNNQTILKGDVVEIINAENNFSEFYIELDELTELDNDYDIEFSDIVQQNIFVETPVYLNQKIILTNEYDYGTEVTVNLWNHQEILLLGADSVEIFLKDELISEQPIFKLNLDSLEETELEIIYKYPPVKKEVTFIEETILDLLPKQARVIDSDISTSTIISKKVNIKVYHEGPIHYFDINVPVDELDKDEIKSIYFVEGDEYLSKDADLIMLPMLEGDGED